MRAEQLLLENKRLRSLLELRPSLNVKSQAAQILYEAPDPYSRKVVIDRGAAKEGDVKVGDAIKLQMAHTIDLTVVGIVTFGDQDSSGGATYAGLTLATAEREIAGGDGTVDGIRVVAAPGVTQQELADRIQATLPDGVEAITGEALTKENQDDIQKAFLAFFNTFLTIFAVIAVVVSMAPRPVRAWFATAWAGQYPAAPGCSAACQARKASSSPLSPGWVGS